MTVSYLWQAFVSAVDILASGTEPIRDRLGNALRPICSKKRDALAGVPDQLAKRVQKIVTRATREKAKGAEGAIAAACRSMSDKEATALAKEIVTVFYEVCELKVKDELERTKKQKSRKGSSNGRPPKKDQ